MRIGIDASPIVGDRGGVGWHTYYLMEAMLAVSDDVEFIGYLRPGSVLPEDARSWRAGGRMTWVESAKWAMRWRGWADRLDLYHGTNFKLHTIGRHGGIVTIHDLWLERFPQYSTKVLGQRWSSIKARRTAQRAATVVTVSDFSARELNELYLVPRERLAVIPNGVADDFAARRDDRAMAELRTRIRLSEKPYLLFIGGADPRKNHRRFLEAASLMRRRLQGHSLLLVGSTDHAFGSYHTSAVEYGLTAQVCCPGRLGRADLQLLYTYADQFVFPSLYEGFGMPVLEAMACGTPVITSRTTGVAEAAGDAALSIDPEDPRSLGEAMVSLLEDASLRASLIAKGFERVKRFSWRSAAAKTLDLYRRLCRERIS